MVHQLYVVIIGVVAGDVELVSMYVDINPDIDRNPVQ